jgi:hypothetical protein
VGRGDLKKKKIGWRGLEHWELVKFGEIKNKLNINF